MTLATAAVSDTDQDLTLNIMQYSGNTGNNHGMTGQCFDIVIVNIVTQLVGSPPKRL